jgi:hydrogenase maturation protease
MTNVSGHPGDILVIGVGNDYRCDDAVGLLVARKLRPKVPSSVEVIEMLGDGSALMDAWKGRRAVIIIDAVAADAYPGTIYRFNLPADDLPSALLSSTHAFGVAEAVELAKALEELPPRVVLYGIQGKLFTYGIGLTSEVALAADLVVTRVLESLQHVGTRRPVSAGRPPKPLPTPISRSHP